MGDRRLSKILGWGVGGGLVAMLLAGGATYGYLKATRKAEESAQTVKEERVARQQAVAEVAPAPLPRGLPFVEREGKDAFGYPRSYVDQPGLRALLDFERYRELTAAFEHFQSDFEADYHAELWPLAAAAAFGSAVPRLRPLLDAWQKETPESFAPYLARGNYLIAVAWAQRGSAWSKDTAHEDMKLFRETARLALDDLNRAIELRPRLLAAHASRLAAFQALKDGKSMRTTVHVSEAICRDCLTVRASFLRRTTPRWGGSYEEMDRFVAAAPTDRNPALKLLAAIAEDDRADWATYEKDYPKALEHAEKACAVGPYAYALQRRAQVKEWMGRTDEALVDVQAGIELRPDEMSLLIDRSRIYLKKQRFDEAATDLLTALRVESTDADARRILGDVYHGVIGAGDAAAARGDRSEAIRFYDLAEALYPFSRDLQQKRSAAIVGGMTGTPAEIAELEAALAARPDDFLAFLRFDYVLAAQRAYPRIIAAWSGYIQRHPDDARAYQERSGAYFNSGQRAEAQADSTRACQLGHHQACGQLRQWLARSPAQAE